LSERDPNGAACQHALNYDDAMSFCASVGGRLCTAAELEAGCTQGTGCSHDTDLLWSSTQPSPSPSPSPSPEPEPEPEPEPAPGPAASGFLYDLGCGGSHRIRELAPADAGGLSGAPSEPGSRERCYKERAQDDITGLSVWASAVMLGRWAADNGSQLVGKHCLELGAGTGLSGLAVAAAMATATENGQPPPRGDGAGSLHLTDFAAKTMENLRFNLGANCERAEGGEPTLPEEEGGEERWVGPGGCALSLSRMDWDDDATWPRGTGAASKPAADAADNGAQSERQFDVVLGADLLYTRSYARKVASVATRLLKPGGLLVLTTPRARGGYGERTAEAAHVCVLSWLPVMCSSVCSVDCSLPCVCTCR